MSYVVTLTLGTAWLSDPTDPLSAVAAAGSRHTSDSTHDADGDFTLLAGNRTQARMRSTTTDQFPFTMSALTIDQYRQIEAWRGRTLLLRTFDGERTFGAYLTVSKHIYQRAIDTPGDPFLYDASFTFRRVSYDESV